MSDNKFRYYDVTTVTTVKALNQRDAIALSTGNKKVAGQVLSTETIADRISAAEARS